MPEIPHYKCPKCSGTDAIVDEIRTTGGAVSALFDLQNKRFTSVTCKKCSYTELYRVSRDKITEVFDFLT